MSEDSPYTFHAVGAEGEPTHYELRDVSGRVVCKAFMGESSLYVISGGQPTRLDTFRRAFCAEVESYMREVARV